MSKRLLEASITGFGFLSFLSLIGFFLALHDIWHDFASPEVWSRAGQPLPDWYSPYNRCPLEWGMLQIGFFLIVVFHVLLFVRLLVHSRTPLNSAAAAHEISR